jgi:23S rRNA A1618 N6-methylase RlmF
MFSILYRNDYKISKGGSNFWCSGGNKSSVGRYVEVLSHKVRLENWVCLGFQEKWQGGCLI